MTALNTRSARNTIKPNCGSNEEEDQINDCEDELDNDEEDIHLNTTFQRGHAEDRTRLNDSSTSGGGPETR